MLTCCRLSPLLLEWEGGVRFRFGIQVPNGVTLKSDGHHLLLQDWELPKGKDNFMTLRDCAQCLRISTCCSFLTDDCCFEIWKYSKSVIKQWLFMCIFTALSNTSLCWESTLFTLGIFPRFLLTHSHIVSPPSLVTQWIFPQFGHIQTQTSTLH